MTTVLGFFALFLGAATSKTLLVHLKDPVPHVELYADLPEESHLAVRTYLASRFESTQKEFHEELATVLEDADLSMPRSVSLWIQNTVVLYDVQDPIEEMLSALDTVESVEEDSAVTLSTAHDVQNAADDGEAAENSSSVQGNIQDLHADEAWKLGWSGSGIVVASIDSGVRFTHETLRATYRGFQDDAKVVKHDYSFWIPASQNQTLTADNADLVGHGTHTMGTVVGRDGIGVAPNATWIAARPFNWDGSAAQSDVLLAAQWVMCPTKWGGGGEDCSRGAHIVSNSFGANSSVHWMDRIVAAWRAAGMLPVFASGNVNGFECGSVLCPGCLADALAVGALVGSKTLWGGSGKGPSPTGVLKPDFVAPGVAIRSASSLGDAKFMRLTGTSMATPHVSGAAAIVLQECRQTQRSCTVQDVVKKLQSTATQALHKPILVPSSCGGTAYNTFPNNIYGYGLPNVLHAVRPSKKAPLEVVEALLAVE
ncbi:hypothetical protein LEN26_019661 [Aphanomyces euteiches]|nr:hypothetical protein LEN26_019661 [Aphanomyces euteiches]KAH9127271.1 hypothetical protein AeMF1_002404 [Aphanomyces euteiches]KAH9193586.1 hypothetical protein AeNC1_004440 [Aphanomyces euteiches]